MAKNRVDCTDVVTVPLVHGFPRVEVDSERRAEQGAFDVMDGKGVPGQEA
jgi:hypothetical protein